MGKKSRRDRVKEVVERSKEERLNEINEIKVKIDNLGLNNNFDGINTFLAIMDQFVDDGLSQSGKIEIPGTKRILEYGLFNDKKKKIVVNLKYDENI